MTGFCATFTGKRPSAHCQASPGGMGSPGPRAGPPGRGFWDAVCSSGKWAMNTLWDWLLGPDFKALGAPPSPPHPQGDLKTTGQASTSAGSRRPHHLLCPGPGTPWGRPATPVTAPGHPHGVLPQGVSQGPRDTLCSNLLTSHLVSCSVCWDGGGLLAPWAPFLGGRAGLGSNPNFFVDEVGRPGRSQPGVGQEEGQWLAHEGWPPTGPSEASKGLCLVPSRSPPAPEKGSCAPRPLRGEHPFLFLRQLSAPSAEPGPACPGD